jgi:hypothetical protein
VLEAVRVEADRPAEVSVSLVREWAAGGLETLDGPLDPSDSTRTVKAKLSAFGRRLDADFFVVSHASSESGKRVLRLFSVEEERFADIALVGPTASAWSSADLNKAAKDIAMAMVVGMPGDLPPDEPEIRDPTPKEPRDKDPRRKPDRRVVKPTPKPGEPEGPPGDGEGEWYEKWWVWTVVGGCVVAATVGVSVWAATPDAPDETATILVRPLQAGP